MYVQIEKKYTGQLEDYLKSQDIGYKISDAPLPLITATSVMVVEFDRLTEQQKQDILAVVKQLQIRKSPTRHRPWEDEFHTPMEEAKGWWKGKSTEEEVEYERDETV